MPRRRSVLGLADVERVDRRRRPVSAIADAAGQLRPRARPPAGNRSARPAGAPAAAPRRCPDRDRSTVFAPRGVGAGGTSAEKRVTSPSRQWAAVAAMRPRARRQRALGRDAGQLAGEERRGRSAGADRRRRPARPPSSSKLAPRERAGAELVHRFPTRSPSAPPRVESGRRRPEVVAPPLHELVAAAQVLGERHRQVGVAVVGLSATRRLRRSVGRLPAVDQGSFTPSRSAIVGSTSDVHVASSILPSAGPGA